MKLSDIKTREQFIEVANIWNQRTAKLKDIVFDKAISEEKRDKAKIIFSDMYIRMNWIDRFNIDAPEGNLNMAFSLKHRMIWYDK